MGELDSGDTGLWNGLVGLWHLNGDVTATVGTNGTAMGNALAETEIKRLGSGSYYFDGNGDYIVIANMDALEGQSGLTVSAWIKSDLADISTEISTAYLVTQNETPFKLYVDSNEKIGFRVINLEGNSGAGQTLRPCL